MVLDKVGIWLFCPIISYNAQISTNLEYYTCHHLQKFIMGIGLTFIKEFIFDLYLIMSKNFNKKYIFSSVFNILPSNVIIFRKTQRIKQRMFENSTVCVYGIAKFCWHFPSYNIICPFVIL